MTSDDPWDRIYVGRTGWGYASLGWQRAVRHCAVADAWQDWADAPGVLLTRDRAVKLNAAARRAIELLETMMDAKFGSDRG